MDLGTAVASAWSSGISVYGVVAVLGLAGRQGWIESPELLQRPWVIGVALLLFLVELFVDKIAYVDSAWDAVHTVIRPAVGGYVMTQLPAQQLPPAALALSGVVIALSSHGAKAGARAVINTSPEPFSNVAVSAAEDGLVAAVMVLAIAYPRVALVVALILTVVSIVAAVLLFRAARGLWRRWGARKRPPAVE